MQKQAKITSKGQVTVPIEIRRRLGVSEGDRLLFESDGDGARIRPVRSQRAFATAINKYRGIGNPGISSGKKAINKWLREIRGHNDC